RVLRVAGPDPVGHPPARAQGEQPALPRRAPPGGPGGRGPVVRGAVVTAAAPRPDLDGREQLARMVRDLYPDVAMDDLLGPVFGTAGVDWAVHIPKLVYFWAWQLLGDRSYGARNPLRAHEPVHARTPFTPEMYERWLQLFTATVDEGFAGPHAET